MTPKKSQGKAQLAKATLYQLIPKINKQLENFFRYELKNIFDINENERKIAEHILKHVQEHNLRPAKRLRASFVYYAYQLLGGKQLSAVLRAAMSVELVHTGLLIHDDFMDQDDTRRGKPTTHKYYEQYHEKLGLSRNAEHYGASMAVNLGDKALCLGFEILGKAKFKPQYRLSALNRLLRGITNTTIGQSFDVTLEAKGKASEKDIIDLHHAKTAIYTYENPLHVGAILAGANKRDLNLLSRYAIPGGIAFQLRDDILGLFGSTQKTGKPAHSDLRQGKPTLLIIKAFENANSSQKKRLLKIWGNPNIGKHEANETRKIVVDTGSLGHSNKVAIKWAKKSQEAIPAMKKKGWNRKSIDYLDGIAQYMVERDL